MNQLYSIEAEQSVLGGLMIDNSTWDQVADKLSVDDFSRRDHRFIFEAIAALSGAGQLFDPITLKEWLDGHGKLDEAGGLAYLGTLPNCTPTAANIAAYAKIVRDKATLRQINQVGTRVVELAYGPGETSEKLSAAQALIMSIDEQGQRGGNGPVVISEGLPNELDELEQCFINGGPVAGMKTGFIDFDDQTTGLGNSDLIVIAGRPSMGKTSFAMNIAEYVALAGDGVVVFSMEMQRTQLIKRMVASMAGVNFQKYRKGELNERDWPKVTDAVGKLQKAQIFIDETAAISITELRARARRLQREHDIKLVLVDYLQLMSSEGQEKREQEVSSICRGLKALAKEMNIPVIALSQLNRELERRPNKRPIMSDLRESGAIEQDADVIAMLYRDEVYNEDSPAKGLAELIIRKQRNGPTGTVNLVFRGDILRFENYAGQMPDTNTVQHPKKYTGGFDYESVN